ncbi:hypothetical protein AWZ03_005899 [Drosophila navojoa]|uniref:Uncharacterized protein n=1 Tax=Drosophila navojoa TaxID=7232 RepID=A0A484BIX8_DRONA|nr:hypothetical protein AWZ03_005899 [Drosophila navojoa]
MRPGPGLVVMALAFISGARRASTTNTISSGSSSSSGRSITTTTPGTTTTGTDTTTQSATHLPSSYDSTSSGEAVGGGFSYLLPGLHDGSPGDAPAHILPLLQFDYYQRRPALHPPDETVRRARSLERGRGTESTATAAGAPESSESTLISGRDEEQEQEQEQEREQEEEEQEDNSGLPVQYASSRAFDEEADEDIFALVAEDDLFSEESFDRLIKLSEDAATEEEDYNQALSQQQQEQEQEQEQEQDQQQEQEQEKQRETERERQQERARETVQHDESRLVDESVLHAQHNENENKKQKEKESYSGSNNNKRETREEQEHRVNDAYASRLIGLGQRDGGTNPTTATETTSGATGESSANGGPVDLRRSILGSATALTRLNPWISACDLAQPGSTGTDLQVSHKT